MVSQPHIQPGCCSCLKFMKSKAWRIAVFLVCLLSVPGLASCTMAGNRETSGTTAGQADLPLAEIAGGGNLHYQNLVLPVESGICFNASDGQLSVSAADGSIRISLCSQAGGYLACDGSFLFFTSEDQYLTKIRLDGTGQVRIGQTPLKYLICDQDWIYAIEADKGVPVRLKKDGTGRMVLSDREAIALTLSGKKLYLTGPDDRSGLRVVDLESDQSEVILQKQVSSLNADGGFLYYSVPSDGYRLHAWSLTKPDMAISRFSVDKPFVVSGGHLYYISTGQQSRLYRLPVSGQIKLDNLEPELIVDDLVDSFAVIGGWIYYQRPFSSRIYRVAIVDRQIIRIT
jgi:hypothetical protein